MMQEHFVEGIVASRMRGKEREFLVKWRGLAEAVWQPESNEVLKPYYEHYFQMMHCTFDIFPTVLRRRPKKVRVWLEKGELAVEINGKRVENLCETSVEERNLVLAEL